MPFIYETFYQDEPKLAFSILMRRYNLSMGEAQRLIDLKRVYNNGELVEVKNKKLSGEIKVLRFKPISRGLKPIFKSPNFLIFDKPSGVIIHPKKIETPYSLLDEMRTFGSSESNSAHRIDKETSGLVLVSMRKVDEVILKKMFENKSIKKSYIAWLWVGLKRLRNLKEEALPEVGLGSTLGIRKKDLPEPFKRFKVWNFFREELGQQGLGQT